jgi:hypothetical protein
MLVEKQLLFLCVVFINSQTNNMQIMEENIIKCPKVEKCPIFVQGVLLSNKTGETYKSIYCLGKRHLECKRFLASKKCSKPIPVQVLPNAFISVDEIVRRVESGFYDVFNKAK